MGEACYVVPRGPIIGTVSPPGSKSLTQRYLNLALISGSGTILERPLISEDTEQFAAALEVCGFEVDLKPRRLELRAPTRWRRQGDIFCGNGGTMFRFLTAALAGIDGSWRLDGISRLRERPVGPLISALRQLGARIDSNGFAPVRIEGGQRLGGRAALDAGSSSQFLSALLMVALRADLDTTIEVTSDIASAPYVDLTLAAISLFGGRVERPRKGVFEIAARQHIEAPSSIPVEADYSAAAYPAAAAAIAGGVVTIHNLSMGSAQGDREFLDVLVRMGTVVSWRENAIEVRGGSLRAIDVDMARIPDQVPTLAAIAPFAEGTTVIRNVRHLRIKESDRLRAMREELERVGVPVKELEDGLEIEGCWARGTPPRTAVEVETHGDHRIAMSMAVLGLRRPGVAVRNPEVVAKSYPSFWEDFESLRSAR